MKETIINGMKFLNDVKGTGNHVIGVYGAHGVGKSRFTLTWGLVETSAVGAILLDRKTAATFQKDAKEIGCNVLIPADDFVRRVNPRKLDGMKEEEQQKFYQTLVGDIKKCLWAMCDSKDVGVILIDTFEQLCTYIEYAENGIGGKFMRIGTKVYQDKRESREAIKQLIRQLGDSGKHIVLTHRVKDKYGKVNGGEEKVIGTTWSGFKELGNECDVVVELVDNPNYNPDREKDNWMYRLNVKECQLRAMLKGPEGNPLLQDDEITLPGLIQIIDE